MLTPPQYRLRINIFSESPRVASTKVSKIILASYPKNVAYTPKSDRKIYIELVPLIQQIAIVIMVWKNVFE
jgi:hypothetical protein